jgi:uncharacterized membrane protein
MSTSASQPDVLDSGQAGRWVPHPAQIGLQDPLRWLAAGARDLLRQPGLSLFYGLAFAVMAQLLAHVVRHHVEYAMSLVSGCLLVGPFMAMGLYEASRSHERGDKASVWQTATCWRHHLPSMGLLVLVLMVLELLWGRASLVVFAVFFQSGGLPTTAGVLSALTQPENLEFILAYIAVGGVFAALVFATSVVSIPMILDRDTDAITAGLTSMRVVLAQPGVMTLWAALIVMLTGLALASWWSIGLLVVGPWLGHATWHAYRSAVRFERKAEPPEDQDLPVKRAEAGS